MRVKSNINQDAIFNGLAHDISRRVPSRRAKSTTKSTPPKYQRIKTPSTATPTSSNNFPSPRDSIVFKRCCDSIPRSAAATRYRPRAKISYGSSRAMNELMASLFGRPRSCNHAFHMATDGIPRQSHRAPKSDIDGLHKMLNQCADSTAALETRGSSASLVIHDEESERLVNKDCATGRSSASRLLSKVRQNMNSLYIEVMEKYNADRLAKPIEDVVAELSDRYFDLSDRVDEMLGLPADPSGKNIRKRINKLEDEFASLRLTNTELVLELSRKNDILQGFRPKLWRQPKIVVPSVGNSPRGHPLRGPSFQPILRTPTLGRFEGLKPHIDTDAATPQNTKPPTSYSFAPTGRMHVDGLHTARPAHLLPRPCGKSI